MKKKKILQSALRETSWIAPSSNVGCETVVNTGVMDILYFEQVALDKEIIIK